MSRTYIDRNDKPVLLGARVSVKHCTGRYGQTATVTGKLAAINEGGDVYIDLEHKTSHDTRHHGVQHYEPGNRFCISGVFHPTVTKGVFKGYHRHEDYEHGHEAWLEVLEERRAS